MEGREAGETSLCGVAREGERLRTHARKGTCTYNGKKGAKVLCASEEKFRFVQEK